MKKHFTLTEILVVVFLIGLLTTIGFGMYSYAMNSAKESATRALLKRLETALETCNTKLGYIPTTNEDDERKFRKIRFKLDDDGTIESLSFINDGGEKETKVSDDYLKEFLRTIDAENLKKNLQKFDSDYYTLVDNWGQTIYYAYPGKFNKTGYDLYSAGADGRVGVTDKDPIKLTQENLEKSELKNFKDTETNEMLCDDICNF